MSASVVSAWSRIRVWIACALLLGGCANFNVPDYRDKNVEELLAFLNPIDASSSGRNVRQGALRKLDAESVARLPPERKVGQERIVPTLIGLLDRPDALIGGDAQTLCRVLGSYQSDAARILPNLIAATEKLQDPYIRIPCANALVKLSGPDTPQALLFFLSEAAMAADPATSGAPKSKIWRAPNIAFAGIARIGRISPEQASLLKRFITNAPTAGVRLGAARAYWKVTGDSAFAVEQSVAMLRQSNQPNEARSFEYHTALSIVFDLGVTARSASPILQKMMRSEEKYCPDTFEAFSRYPNTLCRVDSAVALWRADPSQRDNLLVFFEEPQNATAAASSMCRLELSELAPLVPALRKAKEASQGTRYESSRIEAVLRYAAGQPDSDSERGCQGVRNLAGPVSAESASPGSALGTPK